METRESPPLRRGWTTGACATAAVRAGLCALWGGAQLDEVQITLPKGERPVFKIAHREVTADWMVDLWVDVQFPAAVVDGALVILEGKEYRVAHGF